MLEKPRPLAVLRVVAQVGVLAAILEKEPEPISVVQPMTPPALDKLIRTCLAKDPDERWQSAHDLKLQLEAISEMGSKAGEQYES